MYKGKFLIAGVVITAALLGCSKDEEPVRQTTPAPSLDQSFETDAKDVFDEFFETEEKPVRESQPQTTRPTPPRVTFTEGGRYVTQVATVKSLTAANKLSSDLNDLGFPAYVAKVENPSPNLYGTYYRVRIGGFTGISIARSFGENSLQPQGYDYWVDNRANDNVGISGSGFGQSQSSWDTPARAEPQQEPVDSPTPRTTTASPPAEPKPVSQPPQQEQETVPSAENDDDNWGTDDWGSGW